MSNPSQKDPKTFIADELPYLPPKKSPKSIAQWKRFKIYKIVWNWWQWKYWQEFCWRCDIKFEIGLMSMYFMEKSNCLVFTNLNTAVLQIRSILNDCFSYLVWKCLKRLSSLLFFSLSFRNKSVKTNGNQIPVLHFLSKSDVIKSKKSWKRGL